MLGVACGFGAGTSLSIIASQQVKQVRGFEFHLGICFALFVNEQRKADARFLAKRTGINAIAKANGGQVRSAFAEGRFVEAQLRDVLAAEDSPVMPQKDNDRRLADPQRTKAEFSAVGIRQGNHRKTPVPCAVHAFHSESSGRCVKLALAT